MKALVYTKEGKESGLVELPKRIFGLPWNADLVHQVVTSMQANRRLGLAEAKTRGEVRGGGRKPWRQKGTGRARHGSIRSPLWRGGGVTHGPRTERDYTKKINQRMRVKALHTVLAEKSRAGELLWLKDLSLAEAKTRGGQAVLQALAQVAGYNQLGFRRGRRALIALPKRDERVIRSFRNLPTVEVEEARNLNPLEILRYKHLILVEPTESMKIISKTKHETKQETN